MSTISCQLNIDSEKIIEKSLATQIEINYLKKGQCWKEKWWIPINWACCLAQKEQNTNGHLPHDGYEIILSLVKLKEKLDHVAEYSHNPIPGLCAQAVYFVFWSFLVFGAIHIETTNYNYYGFMGIFLVSYLYHDF